MLVACILDCKDKCKSYSLCLYSLAAQMMYMYVALVFGQHMTLESSRCRPNWNTGLNARPNLTITLASKYNLPFSAPRTGSKVKQSSAKQDVF
jgi:hypothetical protein